VNDAGCDNSSCGRILCPPELADCEIGRTSAKDRNRTEKDSGFFMTYPSTWELEAICSFV
jgi:hypothetical protein